MVAPSTARRARTDHDGLVPAYLAHIAINSDDDVATRRFWERLFGWRFEDWGPPGFANASLGPAPMQVAAIQRRRELVEGVRTTGPELTIAVDDLDAVLADLEPAGGRLVMGRSTIPSVGELAFVADPSGNVIGVIRFDGD
jgi:uncharacterized protein